MDERRMNEMRMRIDKPSEAGLAKNQLRMLAAMIDAEGRFEIGRWASV